MRSYRAYIAASRRSDRSLEARVESARRASEIHKRRTGRSLRVREEDVMNEEMYEEEDDDMSSHARRTFALAGLTGPFSDRLQSSLAMQIGMRDALHQALQRNELMLKGASNFPMANTDASGATPGGANMFSPNMYVNAMGAPMMSPQAMQAQFNGEQQQWQGAMNMQQQHPSLHMRSASISSPQEAYQQFQQQQQQQQFRNATMQNNSVFNLRLDARRTSMPAPQQSMPLRPSQSPVGSNPSTPHGGVAISNASQSPHQVPTPPYSASAYTPGHNSSAGSPSMATAGTPMQGQRSNSIGNHLSNPLSMQLPNETQQLLGFQTPTCFRSGSPPSLKPNSYTYNPNGQRSKTGTMDMTQSNTYGLPQQSQFLTMQQLQQMQMQMPFTGLDQTISPSALDNNFGDGGDIGSNDLPSSAVSAPADFGYENGGYMGMSTDEYTSAMNAGVFGDDHDFQASNGEPNWNPEDFVNFGPPT